MSSTSPTSPRSVWQYFPHAMIAGLGLVVAINAGMIYAALHTFPGVAATDVFDHSNTYDAVLQQSAREAALGWTVATDMVAVSPVIHLADRDGQPISGGRVVAEARRPLGPDLATALAFIEASPGRYVAAEGLPARGQWDLRLTVTRDDNVAHATRRVLVK